MSMNVCFPGGTREAGMWVFYGVLGLTVISVFVSGFKSGWREENILRRVRCLTRSKLMQYSETVGESHSGPGLGVVHNLIESRND